MGEYFLWEVAASLLKTSVNVMKPPSTSQGPYHKTKQLSKNLYFLAPRYKSTATCLAGCLKAGLLKDLNTASIEEFAGKI